MTSKPFKIECILCEHLVEGSKKEACCDTEGCPQTLSIEELFERRDYDDSK